MPPELDNFDHLLMIGRLMGPFAPLRQRKGLCRATELQPTRLCQDPTNSTCWTKVSFQKNLREAYRTLTDDLITATETIWNSVGLPIDSTAWRLPTPAIYSGRDDSAFFVDLDDARSGPAVQDLWMLLSGDRPTTDRPIE